jgi:BAG domain
MKKYKI